MKKITTIVLGATLAVLFAGCGSQTIAEKVAEGIIENETGAEVENLGEGGMKLTIPGENGEEVTMQFNTEGGDIPEKLEANVPIYKPSKLISSTELGEMGTTGAFETDGTKQNVKDFYLAEMADWTKQAEMDFGDQITLSFIRGEEMVTIGIFAQDEKTGFSMNYTKQSY